jgi:hypothetical protein
MASSRASISASRFTRSLIRHSRISRRVLSWAGVADRSRAG